MRTGVSPLDAARMQRKRTINVEIKRTGPKHKYIKTSEDEEREARKRFATLLQKSREQRSAS